MLSSQFTFPTITIARLQTTHQGPDSLIMHANFPINIASTDSRNLHVTHGVSSEACGVLARPRCRLEDRDPSRGTPGWAARTRA